MENKSHAIAAGTFVLLMMGLLVAMVLWLTRDTSEQRQFEISSKEGVTGLQPQAGVRYKGVTVGRVTAISLDAQTRGNVLVRMDSRHDHGVGVDSRGDIYAGLTVDRGVDKFVRIR